MMRFSQIPGLLVFGVFMHVAYAASAEPLTIVTEDYPPFNLTKTGGSEVIGISTDLLRKAFEKTGIQYNISLYPWARSYDMAMTTTNTCVYSTTRTEEREPLFKWVGPLVNDDWVLLGRSDSPKLNSLNDAKPYTVGGYQGDAEAIFLKSQGIKVDEANADHLNPQKLMAKRIDYWATSSTLGLYVASHQGITGLVPILTFKKTQLFLACNKAVPDDVVSKLNASIKQLTDDGTLATITKSYQ
jgi:polar amino acid transport system substrate-binding protein